MSTPNFQSILGQSPTEVVRRPPMPAGTYLCVVGDWEAGQSSLKKTEFRKFALKPIAAMDDVDPAALEEVGGLEGTNLSTTFYITPDAIMMLDEFHENCGVDMTDGSTRKERNDEVKNAQILAVVSHRIDDRDPSRVYAEVRRTAKAD